MTNTERTFEPTELFSIEMQYEYFFIDIIFKETRKGDFQLIQVNARFTVYIISTEYLKNRIFVFDLVLWFCLLKRNNKNEMFRDIALDKSGKIYMHMNAIRWD